MGSHTESVRTSRVRRSVRTSLVLFVAFAVLILALILLERSGPAPVRPLLQNVSSTKPVTLSDGNEGSHHVFPPVIPNEDKNPKKHCDDGQGKGQAQVQTGSKDKGKGGGEDDRCRQPSGGRRGD